MGNLLEHGTDLTSFLRNYFSEFWNIPKVTELEVNRDVITQITPEIFCTLSCTVYCKTSCFVVLFPFYCLPDGGGAVVGITEVAVSARDDGAENKAINGHRGQKYF